MGVNFLRNSFKISDTRMTEFFVLIFFERDQETWQKYRRAHLTSVSDPLTCWMSISFLTWGFLCLEESSRFAVFNLKDNSLLVSYFFFKVFKILCTLRNAEKIKQILFDLKIIAFELVVLNTGFKWERILVIWCQYVNK